MNWKTSVVLVFLVLIIGVAYFFVDYEIRGWEMYYDELAGELYGTMLDLENLKDSKEVTYENISLDNSKIIRKYKIKFNPHLHHGYYEEYYPNQVIITVKDLENSKEKYIFTGDDWTGDPKWLGNDHVFFESRCGTACKGIYLIDTRNKETWRGTISYMFGNDKQWIYFRDWFGREHTWDGLVDEIMSETIDGKSYLIFKMEDEDGNVLGEKKFLFTGEELIDL